MQRRSSKTAPLRARAGKSGVWGKKGWVRTFILPVGRRCTTAPQGPKEGKGVKKFRLAGLLLYFWRVPASSALELFSLCGALLAGRPRFLDRASLPLQRPSGTVFFPLRRLPWQTDHSFRCCISPATALFSSATPPPGGRTAAFRPKTFSVEAFFHLRCLPTTGKSQF